MNSFLRPVGGIDEMCHTTGHGILLRQIGISRLTAAAQRIALGRGQLLSVWHPDILDLRRAAQVVGSLALLSRGPAPRPPAIDPGCLEIARRGPLDSRAAGARAH